MIFESINAEKFIIEIITDPKILFKFFEFNYINKISTFTELCLMQFLHRLAVMNKFQEILNYGFEMHKLNFIKHQIFDMFVNMNLYEVKLIRQKILIFINIF